MLYFFIKFIDEKSYVNDFLSGNIYMNRLSYFKKIEQDDEDFDRADKHEGAFAWLQPGQGRLTINGQDITGDLAGPIEMYDNELDYLNIFCLYAAHSGNLDVRDMLKGNDEAFRQQIRVPKDCLKLGEYAVLITNLPKFVQRMEAAAKSRDYKIYRGLVRYYDPETFHGYFSDGQAVFRKHIRHQSHREYRFVVDTGLSGDKPIILKIGDIRDITLRFNTVNLNEILMNGRIEVDP